MHVVVDPNSTALGAENSTGHHLSIETLDGESCLHHNHTGVPYSLASLAGALYVGHQIEGAGAFSVNGDARDSRPGLDLEGNEPMHIGVGNGSFFESGGGLSVKPAATINGIVLERGFGDGPGLSLKTANLLACV